MCYWCKIDITGNCMCLKQHFYYLSTQHTTTPRWAAASLPPAALPSIANPTSATPINHCTTASYGPWHAPRAGLTLAVCCSLVCGINIKHIKNREMSRSMAFGGRRLGMEHKNWPAVSGSRNRAVKEEVQQGWKWGGHSCIDLGNDLSNQSIPKYNTLDLLRRPPTDNVWHKDQPKIGGCNGWWHGGEVQLVIPSIREQKS